MGNNGENASSTTQEKNVDVSNPTTKPADIFRDTPVRYLGYANEVGEAFRSFVHVNVVRASYGISIAYVLADVADKGVRAKQKVPEKSNGNSFVLREVSDGLLWQGLATVAIPGLTINRIVWLSKGLLSTRFPLSTSKIISTAIGLTAIPFIIKPIDHGVDLFMDSTFRKWF